MKRLPGAQRDALTLRYLEEYDTRQTAKILGICPNTVKTRLLRARDALRAFLERLAPEHGATLSLLVGQRVTEPVVVSVVLHPTDG